MGAYISVMNPSLSKDMEWAAKAKPEEVGSMASYNEGKKRNSTIFWYIAKACGKRCTNIPRLLRLTSSQLAKQKLRAVLFPTSSRRRDRNHWTTSDTSWTENTTSSAKFDL